MFWANEIAIVHVINRTVHPGCLLVDDPVSGKNFDHRQDWMRDQLEVEARKFGFDLIWHVLVVNIFT